MRVIRILLPLAIGLGVFASPVLAQPASSAATPPHIPPEAVGNEANAAQLKLAKAQGGAYARAVAWEREGAAWSAETRAGDFLLVAAISPAEGGWDLTPSGLRWSDPPPGAVHLRVFAADGGDGRSVPGATLHARFVDAAGATLANAPLPAGLYPLTDAYGADVPAPPPGATALVVTIDPLPWRRHDPYNGDRFSTPTVARFALADVRAVSGPPASLRAEHAPPELKAGLNQALGDTVTAMWSQANAGSEKKVGDYTIDYAVEYGEAYWEFHKGRFRYAIENENNARRNAHLEVVPRDGLTGNFLPGVTVKAVVTGPDGPVPPPVEADPVGSQGDGGVPLMWHSWLYHYGENWRVPKAGTYRMQVHFTAPTARRYGRASGDRMAEPVDLTFDGVTIKTGQK